MKFKFTQTPLSGVMVIEPTVFGDARGWVYESHNKQEFAEAGIMLDFVQDNFSLSAKGALRGLHYQLEPYAQAKLARVTHGAVLDVVVDVRTGSPTFGQWFSVELSAINKKAIFVPVGFAHGFCALADDTEFMYKFSSFYKPESQRTIRWDDPALGIVWPTIINPELMSDKDKQGLALADGEFNFNYSDNAS